jgi:hypothetical protein
MSQSAQEEFRRYAAMVEAALPPVVVTFQPQSEGPASVQVERGLVFPLCLRDPHDPRATEYVERLIALSAFPHLGEIAVVDRAGHRRPAYRPLLVYCALQAFRLAYETLPRADFGRWEEGLRPWADALEAELTGIDWRGPDGGREIPAGRGDDAVRATWSALALFVAGHVFIRDAWTDLAGDTFGRLTRAQTTSGAWLAAGPADNPEAHWFDELVLLHAAASYAVQAEDRPLAAAVARNTEFQQRETQPDHATREPWGLFAFVWNAGTRPLAEQLLHAASVQQAGSAGGSSTDMADGVSSILLADALYCLRLFG